MLSKQMLRELNGQVKIEFESAYAYLALSSWCELANFKGGAHFFRLQYEEELVHAMKLFDYVVDRRQGKIELQAIGQPNHSFENLLNGFNDALKSEQLSTANIRRILEMAHEERDYATVNILNWFADEQAEEESLMDYYVDRLELVGTDGSGLILVDNELLARKLEPEDSA